MTSGITVSQRDIVPIPFPYSDMNQQKRRPVIILSDSEYNSSNPDIICCAITSNPRNYAHSIDITNSDLESGTLMQDSRVKPTKVFTLEQNRIVKRLCKLNISKSKEIVKNLNVCIKIEE